MAKKKCIWIIPRECTPEERKIADDALEVYNKIQYAPTSDPKFRDQPWTRPAAKEAYAAYKKVLFDNGMGVLLPEGLMFVGKRTMEEHHRTRFVRADSGYARRYGATIPE